MKICNRRAIKRALQLSNYGKVKCEDSWRTHISMYLFIKSHFEIPTEIYINRLVIEAKTGLFEKVPMDLKICVKTLGSQAGMRT